MRADVGIFGLNILGLDVQRFTHKIQVVIQTHRGRYGGSAAVECLLMTIHVSVFFLTRKNSIVGTYRAHGSIPSSGSKPVLQAFHRIDITEPCLYRHRA